MVPTPFSYIYTLMKHHNPGDGSEYASRVKGANDSDNWVRMDDEIEDFSPRIKRSKLSTHKRKKDDQLNEEEGNDTDLVFGEVNAEFDADEMDEVVNPLSDFNHHSKRMQRERSEEEKDKVRRKMRRDTRKMEEKKKDEGVPAADTPSARSRRS